eukprot:scaffold28790_cov160-Skeletonema_menzelii.AAC.4
MVLGRRGSSASRSSGLMLGDDNFGSETQQPPIIRRNSRSGDFNRYSSSFHNYRPRSNRRNSDGDNARDMHNNNHNRNQEWAAQDIGAPNLQRRVSKEFDNMTKHSSDTRVHSNTTRAETFVSNMRDYNNSAPAPPKEEERRRRGSFRGSDTSKDGGGRHRGSDTAGGRPKGSGTAGNTSRIIAERKRRATGNGMDAMPNFRRDPLVPGNHSMGPNRRATDMQANIPSMRRVNTASGALEKMGNKNFAPQKLQAIGRPIRRNSTGLDLRAVGEHTAFGNSNVSEIYDEFNDSITRGNPDRRRSLGNASDKSNEQRFPSGVGGRKRRTTRSSDGGRRRATRSSSVGRDSHRNSNNPQDPAGGDVNEELRQLRMNHHRQQQLQQQSPHRPRRRSSMTNSELSYGLDEGEMAVITAPLGGRLSEATNPNSEMGGFLREAAYEANKSEHSWYMGRDPSHSSRYAEINTTRHSTGTSRHSTAPSVAVSAVPSVRTNDQNMFHNLLRGITPGSRKTDDLLTGFTPMRGGRKQRWYERHSLSKRTIAIAFTLVFLAVAMLGAVLLLSERGIGFDSGGRDEPGPGANVNHVKPPPSDIDGRCSSSNLPGSLPACLEACYPASCCYSNSGSGARCLDANDSESVKACQRYRPHCDIFHDTWDGATDGVLRTPRADLVPICQQVNGKGEKQSSKLRARNLLSRNLLVETAEVVCSQYCEAAKCCAKDTVFHPYSAGLELSASGVYTDAETKEYVVTNCQDALVYQKNKDLCAEYDKFCMWEDVEKSEKSDAWTSRPTLDPASTTVPSASPSKVPSVSPSMTMRPSLLSQNPSHAPSINVFTIEWITKQPVASPSTTPSNSISPSHKFKPSSQPSLSSMPTIPRANITSVEAACAGADNIALMADGNETARTKCIDACSEGLCCYTEQLGYSSSIQSCYIGNEAVCEEYSACLWLQQSGELTLDSTNAPNTVSNGTVIVNADVTSLNSSIVVNETIATNNNFTSLNNTIVFDGTSAPSPKPSSVSFETATSISDGVQYSNFTNTTSFTILTVPPPPSELAALCALGQGRFCAEICKDVSCCFEEAPELSCFGDNAEICEGYAPCSVLYPQGS